jgi:hypothetical protein
MAQARDRFTERYLELHNKALTYFEHYPPEAKDEAIANAFYLTWYNFRSLVKRRKATDTTLTTTFWFSCRQTRAGRVMKTDKHSHTRELYDHANRIGAPLQSYFHFDAYISKRASVPDIVSFRIDTPAWLDSLSPELRKRAIELAQGTSAVILAKLWKMSQAYVSMLRRQLSESYQAFMSCEQDD